MFISKQKQEKINKYQKLLTSIGSLSNLFSNNRIPYLHYRVTENAFCRAFEADNYSRSDTSVDAGKNSLGIGLKTFLNGNGRTYQKVAEFNKKMPDYAHFRNNSKDLLNYITSLRNTRLELAQRTHDVTDLIYHCVVREEENFIIFEEPMDFIKTDNISIIHEDNKILYFSDGLHKYSFNISKSTLFKQFLTKRQFEFPVEIIEDPFEWIENLIYQPNSRIGINQHKIKASIILPLYSPKTKKVQEKSGLNQWNAGGRSRHPDEVYISIPHWIHDNFPGFFPPKDKPFNLKLPNKQYISAKVCQDGNKALMSNPNTKLGEWLLRTVLKIPYNQLLSYQHLEEVGIDSVEIIKFNNNEFEINFKELGNFEEFQDQYKNN